MALVTCMDSQGEVALFGFPSKMKYPLLRAHPIQMYVSPSSMRSGRVLYAILPFKITPDHLEHYFSSKEEMSRYDIHTSGNMTLLVHRSNLGGASDAWRTFFCPVQDFSLAMARAVRVALDHKTAYHDVVERFDGDLANLEQAALRGEINWAIPVFDTQRSGSPMWIFHIDPMRIKLGISPGIYEPSVRLKLYRLDKSISWDKDALPLGDRINMMDPERASIDLGISRYIHVPFRSGGEFDPGDPPLPDDVVLGRTFRIEGESWSFVRSIPPSRWGQGWYYIIKSEHGVYSSLGQRQLMIMARSNWLIPPVIGWSPTLDELYCLVLGKKAKLPSSLKFKVFHKGKNWVRTYVVAKNQDGSHSITLKRVIDERTYEAAKRSRGVREAMKLSRAKKASEQKAAQEERKKSQLNRFKRLKGGLKRRKASSVQPERPEKKTSKKRSLAAIRKLKKRRTGRAELCEAANDGSGDRDPGRQG